MWLDSLSSRSAAAGLCALNNRVAVLETPLLFHRFIYYREYSAHGVPNFTILWITFSKEFSTNVWPIMNHYIATSAVLFQDAVLYYINATFRPLENASPSYLLPVLVFTPGQWGHQVSLSVTASLEGQSTDKKYGLEKNLRNKSGSSLTAKGEVMITAQSTRVSYKR